MEHSVKKRIKPHHECHYIGQLKQFHHNNKLYLFVFQIARARTCVPCSAYVQFFITIFIRLLAKAEVARVRKQTLFSFLLYIVFVGHFFHTVYARDTHKICTISCCVSIMRQPKVMKTTLEAKRRFAWSTRR